MTPIKLRLLFFFHLNSHRIFFWLFFFTLIAQIFFWQKTENFKPSFDIVPPAPNKYLVSTISLGDNEFLFRALAIRLQSSGDVFAGFVALRRYDYSRIYDWMMALDKLNPDSTLVPSLASYYYSNTQNKPDTRYIVNYLYEHSLPNVDANWWWLFQATYIAKDVLKDLDLALKVAQELAKNEAVGAPLWTKQMPAFVSEKMEDGCMAFQVIKKLLDEGESGKRKITAEEMSFMRQFISERLSKLKKQKFDPRKCSKNL